ncbi:glycerol-3-phosphate dehydrogenase, partial [Planococcus sp. SIMBA_160]
MEKVTIFAPGSWGTALGYVLAPNGHELLLWSHRQDQADVINNHTNERYLKGVQLPDSLKATADL